MFVSTHVIIAKATGISEIEITEAEGENFLKAAENVARHYGVQQTQKTLDWIAFVGIGVQIYGTRAVCIITDRKTKKPIVGQVAPPPPPVHMTIVPDPEEHH